MLLLACWLALGAAGALILLFVRLFWHFKGAGDQKLLFSGAQMTKYYAGFFALGLGGFIWAVALVFSPTPALTGRSQ